MTREEFLRKEKQKRIITIIARIGILAVLLLLWQLLTVIKRPGSAETILDPFIFSSPTRVVKAIKLLLDNGTFWKHIWATTYETFLGFAIGTALGCLIAAGLWWSERARKILDPYIVVLNSLPKIALGPIIIVWMGTGQAAIVTIAVLISLIVTIMTMLGGFLETDSDKILLLKTMNASKMQIFTKLVVPSSAPAFINTLKINVGMAWVGSITGEYIVSKAGLGYLIIYGSQVFKLDLVMASIILICILSAAMYSLVALAERLFLKWK